MIRERKIIRKRGWDYRWPGYYFITVTAKKKFPIFGNIENSIMKLNECGIIARLFWNDLPYHFKNIRLDEYIIMPDHVHGIVEIMAPEFHNDSQNTQPKHKLSGSIPAIIGSYKSAVKKYINRIDQDNNFMWHRSFYDRIIRTDEELHAIQNYIRNNPKKMEMI